MASSSRDRLPWEYADGPEVGKDVPITSPPREEVVPGVPAEPVGTEENGAGQAAGQRDEEAAERGNGGRPNAGNGGRPNAGNADGAETGNGVATEVREVEAADPELTAELNQLLTEELREVVGSDRVRVPADRPHAARGARRLDEWQQSQTALGYLSMHRFQVVRALFIALTFGAVISLITNDWWFLLLAAGLHAMGTMAVTLTIIRMTTISERPSPELAAALSEAGVSSPDEYFSRMVEEFRRTPERGAGEVISPGYNERTTPARDDTAIESAVQSSAMTPTAEPSEPGGQRGAPDYLIWSTALALLALSIVLPAVMGGGWMWLLTAVMVPLLAGWMVLQWLLRARGERMHLQGHRPMIAIAVATTFGVVAFCAAVAFAFQH